VNQFTAGDQIRHFVMAITSAPTLDDANAKFLAMCTKAEIAG
jgi:hypothetical protein